MIFAIKSKGTPNAREQDAAERARIIHDGFDADYYVAKYSDVAASGLDPLSHFIQHGRGQNRFTSMLVEQTLCDGFDPVFYLEAYPDVAAEGLDPVWHYLNHGKAEGRLAKRSAKRGTIELYELCNPYLDEAYPALSSEEFFVSIITPTYNTDLCFLQQLYQTLRNQIYSNWEWVVVDDGSTKTPVLTMLRGFAEFDRRVKVLPNRGIKGISGTSNVALDAARGNYCALVDHDDLLSRDALLEIYRAWQKAPQTQLFYTDECKLLTDGTLSEFWAKPGWSPTYLENTMCVGHLAVYLKTFVTDLGGFRPEYDGTQDFDLALRASRANPQVIHLPVFAYLWRISPGSTAGLMTDKSYAVDRQADALLDHARKKHALAIVSAGFSPGYWRIKYPLPETLPLLSLIIPAGGGIRQSRGRKLHLIINCVQSFIDADFFPNMEFIILCNQSLPPEQEEALSKITNARLIRYSTADFSFSSVVNLGVKEAKGEFVCLCNDDIEAKTPQGGRELVSYLDVNPNVGAIAPVCLFEDGTIQQNGVILIEAGPAHAATGLPRHAIGHAAMLRCRREVMCVGGAMFISRKKVYEQLGGFSEDLPMNYNDVDFGLRLKRSGYTSVVDPYVEVLHFESATKSATPVVEQERLFSAHVDIKDDYFNIGFDQKSTGFVLDLKKQGDGLSFGSWLDRRLAHRCAEAQTNNRFKFSVVAILGQQPREHVVELLQSVRMQTYANVELVIVRHALTTDEHVAHARRLAGTGKAKFVQLPSHIASRESLARILSESDGDYVVLIDPDHFLCVDALQQIAHAAELQSKPLVLFSDNYQANIHSHRSRPFFKPDFDPLLFANTLYIGSIIAMEHSTLQKVVAVREEWNVEFLVRDVTTLATRTGRTPYHIREAIYAERLGNKNPKGRARPGCSVEELIDAKGLSCTLSLQPNALAQTDAWKLTASRPVDRLKILDARDLWSGSGEQLVLAAEDPLLEWVAILLDTSDEETILRLSAIAWYEPRVNAVSGVFVDPDGRIRASGGVFLPDGRVFDPYLGMPLNEGGYFDMLLAQRCVDVAAPVNVLIRTSALRNIQISADGQGADALMTALGLAAHEREDFIAVTPHVTAVAPGFVDVSAIDRSGLLLGHPALRGGSRWYDGRLEVARPFCMPGMTPN